MKKNNSKKKNTNEDESTQLSARSIENLKRKEKTDLLKFLNEQLNRPLVFYSSYYKKHGYNILQRNYKKLKDKKEEDSSDEEEINLSEINLKNIQSEKNPEITPSGNGKDSNINNDSSNNHVIYSKRCDEETCYFDLKKKAHAIPMKWFESNKVYNNYQQIPRTTKKIDLNAENDRNANFSLFNRQLLSKSKWEKMDRNMQAKYYIYENPLPDIQNFVSSTAKRNQIYERNIRDQINLIYGKEPTASELTQIIEKQRRESLEASQKANQRIKEQFLWQLDTRNNDLQHLLEGQQTALDAIRLKEYLLLKPIPTRGQLNITNKDRRRISSLLSSR
ncbi:hypothetical protein BCR32DRAFT_267969 [Anaeromyces robustus]|uniref:Uncharacterized protein n=1 Tax=Anaeromyces robustus TaxID=1754192 RepID=A0A1Y1X823_9FUNG|nr:hypothetical protein BCR32DRAFT_267969 [Anaeromyces robustus]|eukprot:ORX81923.1 hypothetical protein BCR32DRAFT_267969 [Anaeromyces robustus]